MKVAVAGFGSQGASALAYWQAQGHTVTVCDKNDTLELPEGVNTQLGEGYLKGLDRFDIIVRSPSIHPREIVKAGGASELDKITSNTNEFMRVCPTRNIIGVTGTKGKGTTSALITRMLESSGYRVHLGGNIGTPPLEMLNSEIKEEDYVVLELANFQLIDIKFSPRIAVCLMVEPEHQDWHTDLDEYIRAKQQLFRWQKPEDTAVYYAVSELSKKVAEVSGGNKIPYFAGPGAVVTGDKIVIGGTEICSVDEIKLRGRHNWQNVCAAVTAVWQITQNVPAIKQAIQTFSGLPFRLEFIKEVDSVRYYNDSFGTTPETAIVAIQAFENPKVVILGGSDKGSSFSELANTIVSNNVRAVITIGATGPDIAHELKAAGYKSIIEGPDTMPGIIAEAQKCAQPGDIVLLSPASASFGLFKNYKDRGEQFNQAVQSLS